MKDFYKNNSKTFILSDETVNKQIDNFRRRYGKLFSIESYYDYKTIILLFYPLQNQTTFVLIDDAYLVVGNEIPMKI